MRACWRAFREEEPLAHEGPYYRLTLLPAAGRPRRHDHEDLRVDIAAVGPPWCAGPAGGRRHPRPPVALRALPPSAAAAGAGGRGAGGRPLGGRRRPPDPRAAAPGDTPEERAPLVERCRGQIAFYGSTSNYAFQFDDLGFDGTSARLNERFKAGDLAGMRALVTDEMLEHYAVVCRWDEVVDRLRTRYGGLADRLIVYTAAESLARHPSGAGRWAEVVRAAASA